MKVAVFKNALDVRIYKACIDSLSTHIATPGVVGSSLQSAKEHEIRKADVRYLGLERAVQMDKIDPYKMSNPHRSRKDIYEQDHPAKLLSEFMKEPYGDLIPEPLQVITYEVGGNYAWHRDGSGEGYRKYSFISVLSPRDQYKGGELEIDGVTLPEYAYDPLSIIIFNPSLRHRVKPVTEGVRHSLVTWFHK